MAVVVVAEATEPHRLNIRQDKGAGMDASPMDYILDSLSVGTLDLTEKAQYTVLLGRASGPAHLFKPDGNRVIVSSPMAGRCSGQITMK